jgi:hypothetical protein
MTIETGRPSTSILDSYPVSRIRRNHGLEHATLHILGDLHPHKMLAGHSDLGGFWILGDISTSDLQAAVAEALRRLQNGEKQLAVHPNCGTNFAASGTLAGIAAALAFLSVGNRLRDRLERLPLAATLATIALILGQPLGMYLQAHITTSGRPGDLQVVEITQSRRGRLTAHRVITHA